MTRSLIDSSILIDCLRGRQPAIAFLSAQSQTARPQTHLLVAAELLAGARNKFELAQIDSFLGNFDLILPTESDGLTALTLFRQFHLSHGTDWPDTQIAATAIRLNLPVYTQNTKHFAAFPNLQATRVY